MLSSFTLHVGGVLRRIGAYEPDLRASTEEDLHRRGLALQYRAHSGECLDRLLPEAYALVREAARRVLNMRPFDVQILGGIAMHRGCVAEMQTGEGKTLTAILPLYLASLAGKGAHLATANDYLASRDAELMRPAFELLGKSVGVLQTAMPRLQRQQAYRCDVTYGAAREFGFDFLRDRLLAHADGDRPSDFLGAMLGLAGEWSQAASVQTDLHFALVDEADSILVDEARTPLIVSSMPGDSPETAEALYRWAAKAACRFHEGTDYEHDPETRTITLSFAGRRKVRDVDKPEVLSVVTMYDLYEHVERAVRVEREFQKDRHYVVREGEAVIVDEFTGRLAEGRRWRDGIHQAVEAKEGLAISVKTGEAARVTVQDFFLQYQRLAGMTGTAASSARELKHIYDLRVRVIPTNRTERRTRFRDRVFASAVEKWEAIVQEVTAVHGAGRPVLVGTRSIEQSEHLSRQLAAAGVEHHVLNAHRHAAEAKIVAAAGQQGRVTVATNMAGRGTDIQLGPGVAALGGLHVICTELHESARIDRQLVGRCARQGDPGSYQQFMSLDDDILHLGFGQMKAARLRHPGRWRRSLDRLAATLRKAQTRVERRHFRQRRLLLYHEQERHKIQRQMGQDPYLDASG
ncbi:MAG: preprotein translocase subunit SecA [Pirellulales bacterium]